MITTSILYITIKFLRAFDLNPFIFSFFIAHVPKRERVKIKKNMGPTSTLEVYLNQQLRRHPSNGDSSRSSTGSPPQQPGLLQVADNQIRCLPVDLNENGKSNKYFCLRIVKFLVSPTNKKIQFYLDWMSQSQTDHLMQRSWTAEHFIRSQRVGN